MLEHLHYPSQSERTPDVMDRSGLGEDTAVKIKEYLISSPCKCFTEIMTEL